MSAPSEHDAPDAVTAVTLSQRFWGLDWREHLPWGFDGVVAEVATTHETMAFVNEHFASIFDLASERSRFFVEPMTAARQRFCREMDNFVFRHDGRIVGVLMAHPSDWSSYYIRSSAFLADYQGRGLLGRCLEQTFEPLRSAGVARVETDTAPSNGATIRLATRLGFNIAGTVNTDRWGALVRLTKFLHEDAQRAFRDQFCPGSPRLKPHNEAK